MSGFVGTLARAAAQGGIQFSKSVKPGSVGGTILSRIFGRPLIPFKFPSLPKAPVVSAGTKATIATVGTTAGVFGTTFLFTQTPGGLQTTKDITGTANNVTKFFSQNPLLLVGIIALGIIVVLKK